MDYQRDTIKKTIRNSIDVVTYSKFSQELALQYYKWISFIPSYQLKQIKLLSTKNVSELNINELKDIKKFKRQQELSDIFKKYISDDCSKKDVFSVYDYIKSHSIDKIIKSKISDIDMEQVEIIIKEYKKITLDKVKKFLQEKYSKENYLNLSMTEAYALYEFTKLFYFENKFKLSNFIKTENKDVPVMRAKYYEKIMSKTK